MDSIGSLLKRKREEMSLTLEEVSSKIKIRNYYLRLIENDELTEIQSQVYTLGYLKLYADFLGFDVDLIVKTYKASEKHSIVLEKVKNSNKIYSINKDTVLILSTFFSIVMIILYGMWYKHNFHSANIQKQTSEINNILQNLERNEILILESKNNQN